MCCVCCIDVAQAAAKIEKSIEQEILQRLRAGTYDGIYNFPEVEYKKALDQAEDDMGSGEDEEEEDFEEAEDEESDEEREFVEVSTASACTDAHGRMYVCACMCVCMCVCMYVCACMCACMCAYVCMHVHAYAN